MLLCADDINKKNFLLYYIRLLGNIMRSYGSLMPVFTMKFVLAPCFTSAQLISVGESLSLTIFQITLLSTLQNH